MSASWVPPPYPPRPPAFSSAGWRAGFLLLAALAAGSFAFASGSFIYYVQGGAYALLAKLNAQDGAKLSGGQLAGHVEKMRKRARANPDNVHIQLALTEACLLAGEELPDGAAYYAEAAQAAEHLRGLLAAKQGGKEVQAAYVNATIYLVQGLAFSNRGEEARALSAQAMLMIGQLPREFQPLMENNLAYVLATAPAPARDPEKALELAARCVKSSPAASREPNYLDTLAMAYYANNDMGMALKVQETALEFMAAATPQGDDLDISMIKKHAAMIKAAMAGKGTGHGNAD